MKITTICKFPVLSNHSLRTTIILASINISVNSCFVKRKCPRVDTEDDLTLRSWKAVTENLLSFIFLVSANKNYRVASMHDLKAYSENGGISPLSLNLSTKWR